MNNGRVAAAEHFGMESGVENSSQSSSSSKSCPTRGFAESKQQARPTVVPWQTCHQARLGSNRPSQRLSMPLASSQYGKDMHVERSDTCQDQHCNSKPKLTRIASAFSAHVLEQHTPHTPGETPPQLRRPGAPSRSGSSRCSSPQRSQSMAQLQGVIRSSKSRPSSAGRQGVLSSLQAMSACAAPQKEVLRDANEYEKEHESLVDVFLRIRPCGARERGEAQCTRVEANGIWIDDPSSSREHYFEFEGVIDSSAGLCNQKRVFELAGEQAVHCVLDGFHTCIFSLGQTGTGKTYTLVGTPEEPGLLPGILGRLLGASCCCRLSCLELHMDRVRDLLTGDMGERPTPEIRSVPHRGVYVSNLCEVSVEEPSAALKLIQMASRNRFVARTSMNSVSSRGHAVFQLTLESGARLCVVDLAGRESEKSTRCRGQLLAELGYINKSLFHLTSVLQALARPNPGALVPFRNSKLTLLLSDSLQSARAILIATISPAVSSVDETLATLRLAQAVRQITTRSRRSSPQCNDDDTRSSPKEPSQQTGATNNNWASAGATEVASADGSTTDGHMAPEPNGIPIPFAPRIINNTPIQPTVLSRSEAKLVHPWLGSCSDRISDESAEISSQQNTAVCARGGVVAGHASSGLCTPNGPIALEACSPRLLAWRSALTDPSTKPSSLNTERSASKVSTDVADSDLCSAEEPQTPDSLGFMFEIVQAPKLARCGGCTHNGDVT